MPEIPITTPFGYLGVFLSILGFFLIVAGLGILNVEKISVKPGRGTWIIGILIAIVGLGLLFFEANNNVDGTPATPTAAVTSQPSTSSTPGVVLAGNTLVYEQQDDKSKVVGTLPMGAKVDVLQSQGKWVYISFIQNNVQSQGWTLKQNVQVGP